MEITQEMIDDAIKNCIWRQELCDIYICRGEVVPCSNVIDNGKCDTLIELFRGGKDGQDIIKD